MPGVLKVALKLKNWAGSSCLTLRDKSFMICNWEWINNYLWCRSLEYLARNSLIILRAVFENKAIMHSSWLENRESDLPPSIFSFYLQIIRSWWRGSFAMWFFIGFHGLFFPLIILCQEHIPFTAEHACFYKASS